MSDVVIVTGASSGIGAATARMLGAQGASVVVNYMSSVSLAQGVVAEVEAAGGSAIAVQADMGSNADIVRMFEETDRAFGPVTGLVNNAAINTPSPRSVESYDFDEVMGILEKLNGEGTTIVMVTHDPQMADQTDRTVRLFDGRQVQLFGDGVPGTWCDSPGGRAAKAEGRALPTSGSRQWQQPRPLPLTQHPALAGLSSGPIAFWVWVHQ